MRSSCPISYALDFLGDKWSMLVIRDLFEGKRFYKEFKASAEGIATNILSDRLKKLEANGFITSRVYEQQKTQKEYFLTEKGKELFPIIVELMLWSSKHQSGLVYPEGFFENMETDKAGTISKVISQIPPP